MCKLWCERGNSLTQAIFEMTQLILKCHVRDMTSFDQFLD